MKVDWLVVGAGFTGATLAERLAAHDQRVLVVDRRDHIGGNAFDYYDEHGVLVHKYGPHIFHTNSQKVWDYLSRFTDWRPYFHRVLASIDGKTVPVPFNLNSIRELFPERLADRFEDLLISRYGFGQKVPILRLREEKDPALQELGSYIYAKVFAGYTEKQWGLSPEQLSPSVTGRVPVSISRDDRYFLDTYQAMPARGYTAMFQKMLAHPNIRVILNCAYEDIVDEVTFGRLAYTGPVDSFFDNIHGELPYRSLRLDLEHHEAEEFQDVAQVNYPNEYDFTRITEFKHLTGQKTSGTTVAVEYPQPFRPGENEPYYPIPVDSNRDIYASYQVEMKKLQRSVMFAGRLADYKYYNMDQAVARGLSLFEGQIVSLLT